MSIKSWKFFKPHVTKSFFLILDTASNLFQLEIRDVGNIGWGKNPLQASKPCKFITSFLNVMVSFTFLSVLLVLSTLCYTLSF